jgi:hypothetical protein
MTLAPYRRLLWAYAHGFYGVALLRSDNIIAAASHTPSGWAWKLGPRKSRRILYIPNGVLRT